MSTRTVMLLSALILATSEASGGILVQDLHPGPNDGFPDGDTTHFGECNGLVYFNADDGVHGNELWSTDGTTASMVKDINPGSEDSYVDDLVEFQGKLYFRAVDGVHGSELWSTDGTTASMVLDIRPGSRGSSPVDLVEFQGKLYFGADDGVHGRELWSFDGTTASMAIDILPGNNDNGYPYHGSPTHLAVFEGKLYFNARDQGETGHELWSTDGTTASMVIDICPGRGEGSPKYLTVFQGNLYFIADDCVHGRELWSTDGTTASMVQDIKAGEDTYSWGSSPRSSNPAYLTVFQGKLYFNADDGVHGRELWSTDGTTASMVKDIYPGSEGSDTKYLTVFQGNLYFMADDEHGGLGETVNEFWSFDGTTVSKITQDFVCTGCTGYPKGFLGYRVPFFATTASPTLYFAAKDAEHGVELWRFGGEPKPPAPPATPPPPPQAPAPRSPPPPMFPGDRIVCDCEEARAGDKWHGAYYCHRYSGECSTGYPTRLSCAKCMKRDDKTRRLTLENRFTWTDPMDYSNIDDLNDGKIDYPEMIPSYRGRKGDIPATDCYTPDSSYRGTPASAIERDSYHLKQACMECLRGVQHPVVGNTRPGGVWSPYSVCFREPDEDRLIDLRRQLPGNGKCQDGVKRDRDDGSNKIVAKPYPKNKAVIDKGDETKDAIASVFRKGYDCTDCGPRCYVETAELRRARQELNILRRACFHGTTLFLRRTPSGQSEAAPVSSLTVGDEVLVWDAVVRTPLWTRLSLFWLRPASGLGQPEPASGIGQQDTEMSAFVDIKYEHVGSGEQHHLVVTRSHYVELRCNDDISNRTLELGMATTDSCIKLAGDVNVGDMLIVWLHSNGAIGEATVVAIDTLMEAMVAYLPLTSSSLHYVLAGGAIVPIDSETPLISGNIVPRDAVLMAANVLMATHNFVKAVFPASWRQAFEAHWLSPEPSVVFGDSVETVHLSNQLALALNTSEEALALLNDQWNNSDTVASGLTWLAAFVSSSLSSTPPGYTADANAGQVVTLTAASTIADDMLFQGGSADPLSGNAFESLAEVTRPRPNGGLGQNVSQSVSPLGTAATEGSCGADDISCQEKLCLEWSGLPCDSSDSNSSDSNSSNSNSSNSNSSDSNSSDSNSSDSTGMIVGVVVGIVILLVLICLFVLWKRHNGTKVIAASKVLPS